MPQNYGDGALHLIDQAIRQGDQGGLMPDEMERLSGSLEQLSKQSPYQDWEEALRYSASHVRQSVQENARWNSSPKQRSAAYSVDLRRLLRYLESEQARLLDRLEGQKQITYVRKPRKATDWRIWLTRLAEAAKILRAMQAVMIVEPLGKFELARLQQLAPELVKLSADLAASISEAYEPWMGVGFNDSAQEFKRVCLKVAERITARDASGIETWVGRALGQAYGFAQLIAFVRKQQSGKSVKASAAQLANNVAITLSNVTTSDDYLTQRAALSRAKELLVQVSEAADYPRYLSPERELPQSLFQTAARDIREAQSNLARNPDLVKHHAQAAATAASQLVLALQRGGQPARRSRKAKKGGRENVMIALAEGMSAEAEKGDAADLPLLRRTYTKLERQSFELPLQQEDKIRPILEEVKTLVLSGADLPRLAKLCKRVAVMLKATTQSARKNEQARRAKHHSSPPRGSVIRIPSRQTGSSIGAPTA